MLAALAEGATDGGVGLTSAGFDTVVDRRWKNSAADFIHRLLAASRPPVAVVPSSRPRMRH
jgi:hypothetical protein